MTEEEARSLMRKQGWTYQERIRHKSHIKYVYAKRWREGTTTERYICRLSRLGDLTEQELLAKLAPKSDQTL
jgi:hypothetical protein